MKLAARIVKQFPPDAESTGFSLDIEFEADAGVTVLFGASGAIGSSFQPPTAADAANADDVHARFERAYAAAKGAVGS